MEKRYIYLKIIDHEKQILRYGENPHQESFFYKKKFNKNLFNSLFQQNKKLSFNNIVDVDSAYECLAEFNEPTCVIIKHNMRFIALN